jgi:hypothetical protein
LGESKRLAVSKRISFEEFELIRLEKTQERDGFTKKLLLKEIIGP